MAFGKNIQAPDAKFPRPRGYDEKLLLIKVIYEFGNWDESDRIRNHKLIGLPEMPLERYDGSQLDLILKDMEQHGMVTFEND